MVNKKGFTFVEIVVSLLVVSVLAGGFFVWWNNRYKSPSGNSVDITPTSTDAQSLSNAPTLVGTVVPTPADASNWKSLNNTGGLLISFKYPPGWKEKTEPERGLYLQHPTDPKYTVDYSVWDGSTPERIAELTKNVPGLTVIKEEYLNINGHLALLLIVKQEDEKFPKMNTMVLISDVPGRKAGGMDKERGILSVYGVFNGDANTDPHLQELLDILSTFKVTK